MQPKGHFQPAKQWTVAQWHPAIFNWAEGSSQPALMPQSMPKTCILLEECKLLIGALTLNVCMTRHESHACHCTYFNKILLHRAKGECCLHKWYAADRLLCIQVVQHHIGNMSSTKQLTPAPGPPLPSKAIPLQAVPTLITPAPSAVSVSHLCSLCDHRMLLLYHDNTASNAMVILLPC